MSVGRVEAIFTFSGKRSPPTARATAKVGVTGVEHDHPRSERRAVTVLSLEAWREVERELGVQLGLATRRANLVVSGVDLATSVGLRLRLGDVELELVGEVEPCERMDEAHPGLKAALTSNLRGGVHGRVLREGTLNVGDPVELLALDAAAGPSPQGRRSEATESPAPSTADPRVFFGRHAAAYATSPEHKAGADLPRLVELLAPRPHERALDVATATGHTALALAQRCADVVGLDLTPQMQAEFEQAAKARGLLNVRFQLGDAGALPFPDASFDLVTSRRAPHHFSNLDKAVHEMARVLRPGGRLGISDMTTPDRPEAALFLNRLEALRDPSHVRARGRDEWRELVAAAGLETLAVEVTEEPLSWEGWLRPVSLNSPEANRAEALLGATPPAVTEPTVRDAPVGRTFLKRRIVLVARKP